MVGSLHFFAGPVSAGLTQREGMLIGVGVFLFFTLIPFLVAFGISMSKRIRSEVATLRKMMVLAYVTSFSLQFLAFLTASDGESESSITNIFYRLAGIVLVVAIGFFFPIFYAFLKKQAPTTTIPNAQPSANEAPQQEKQPLQGWNMNDNVGEPVPPQDANQEETSQDGIPPEAPKG